MKNQADIIVYFAKFLRKEVVKQYCIEKTTPNTPEVALIYQDIMERIENLPTTENIQYINGFYLGEDVLAATKGLRTLNTPFLNLTFPDPKRYGTTQQGLNKDAYLLLGIFDKPSSKNNMFEDLSIRTFAENTLEKIIFSMQKDDMKNLIHFEPEIKFHPDKINECIGTIIELSINLDPCP